MMCLFQKLYLEYNLPKCLIAMSNFQREDISYVIRMLPTLFKKLTTFIQGNGSSPKSKYPLSHTLSYFGFLCIYSALLSLGQFSFVCHKLLSLFFTASPNLTWSTFSLVIVAVSFSSEVLSADSKGINYQIPTTRFYQNVTLFFSSAS